MDTPVNIQVESSILLLSGGRSWNAAETDEGESVHFLAGMVLLGFPGPLEIVSGVAFGPVQVFIEALRQEPVEDLDHWEDMAEFSIEAIQGVALEVRGSRDTLPEPGQGQGVGFHKLNAHGDGWYRVRISARGRDLSPDEQLTTPEEYRFQAWPATPREAEALKQTSARAAQLNEADGMRLEDSAFLESAGETGERDYTSFELQRVDARNVALSLYDAPDWEKIGATEEITMVDADEIKLGPKPAGQAFPALKSLDATWSRGVTTWLRGSGLEHLQIHRPTQATLDALEGVPLRFLRAQASRWSGPLRWPSLDHLNELWYILCKEVDLAGVSALPALRSVRIDGVKHLSNLAELGAGPRLREVHLEDVRVVDDPAQLWQINAEKVTVLGRPSTSPWVVEALRSRPSEQRTPITGYWFPDDFLDAAHRDAREDSLGTVSSLAELEDGSASLSFTPLSLPTAEILEQAGTDSTGDVWADLVTHLWPDLAGRFELDPETELFAAYGNRDDLRQLQEQLEPLLTDENALKRALQGVPIRRLGL